jgi:hypothetical protein
VLPTYFTPCILPPSRERERGEGKLVANREDAREAGLHPMRVGWELRRELARNHKARGQQFFSILSDENERLHSCSGKNCTESQNRTSFSRVRTHIQVY